MPMTREQAVELVERLLKAAGNYDRDSSNYGKHCLYFAVRDDVINALMGMQKEAEG